MCFKIKTQSFTTQKVESKTEFVEYFKLEPKLDIFFKEPICFYEDNDLSSFIVA